MKRLLAIMALAIGCIPTLNAQVINLDKAELEQLGGKYERVENFYEEGHLVKEVRYPKQVIDTLANFEAIVGRLSRETFTYNLTRGDTVEITIFGSKRSNRDKRRRLKMISFIEGESAVRLTAIKTDSLYARLPISGTGPHSISIDNTWRVPKRLCSIQLIRYAEIVPEVYYPAPDSTNLIIDTIPTITVIDSLFNLLIDTSFTIASVLDIERPSSISIPVEAANIDADMVYTSWTYWVGIGPKAIGEYENLIQIVPPSLGMPGGGLPLTAMMKGTKVDLPVQENQDVKVNRRSSSGRKVALSELFYFTNKNTVNYYPVRLIAVGLYTLKRTEPVKGAKPIKAD